MTRPKGDHPMSDPKSHPVTHQPTPHQPPDKPFPPIPDDDAEKVRQGRAVRDDARDRDRTYEPKSGFAGEPTEAEALRGGRNAIPAGVHSASVPVDRSRVARVVHEANRALCLALGEESQPIWEEAHGQHDGAVKDIDLAIKTVNETPQVQHDAWVDAKLAEGWKKGPIDPAAKAHPHLVSFAELRANEKAKIMVARAIVRAMTVG